MLPWRDGADNIADNGARKADQFRLVCAGLKAGGAEFGLWLVDPRARRQARLDDACSPEQGICGIFTSMRRPIITLRLAFVSVALPVVFVALDDAALRYGSAHKWPPATGVAICSLFVVQTALLSYLAGVLLSNWGWRVLLLGWRLVLVNPPQIISA